MSAQLEEKSFEERIHSQLRCLGSQKALANHMGISPQYLSDLLLRRRKPSNRVLLHFGLRWAIVEVDK
jgi:predicted transcriptional regulator